MTRAVTSTLSLALFFTAAMLRGFPAHATEAAAMPATTTATGRAVLLPVFYDYREWTASGKMDLVPDWTEQAKASLTAATREQLSKSGKFQLVELADLSAEEQETLREHLALYKLIALNSAQLIQTGGAAWKDKKLNYDYSIGDGLSFLRQRTSADQAIVVAGAGVRSSGGRIAMGILLAVAIGAVIPPGGVVVTTGSIDLASGDIKWFEFSQTTKGDVRQQDGASKTMEWLMQPYPQSRFLGSYKKRG